MSNQRTSTPIPTEDVESDIRRVVKDNTKSNASKFASGALGVSLFAANSHQLVTFLLSARYGLDPMDIILLSMVGTSMILQMIFGVVSIYLNSKQVQPTNNRKTNYLKCFFYFNTILTTFINVMITYFTHDWSAEWEERIVENYLRSRGFSACFISCR